MKVRKLCVFISLATMLVGVQAALAQFNLPREIPQIMDALKGQAEQPKPAAPAPAQAPAPSEAPAVSQPARAATNIGAALSNNKDYAAFKSWALATREPNPVPNMFKFCIESYDKMIAGGIAPTARVPEETRPGSRSGDPPIVWSGTVQELKENWCEAGYKKINSDVATRHAPYRAALKNDKLKLVIDETHGHVRSYALAAGQYTSDAKRLAAAPVWFLDIGAATNEAQNCLSGGKRSTVRRYAFDGQHNLTGTTSKQYCGSPPSSAYQ